MDQRHSQCEEPLRKPDFSGDYVLNREASSLSALVAPSVQTASLRIKHDEPKFSCEGKFSFLNGETFQWAFELSTDGSEVKQTEPVAPAGTDIQWDGDSLVCTSRNEAMTITFRYEFDAEGHLRLAEQLRGTDHDQDNLWIFDRA